MRWIPASILLTSFAFAAVPYTLPIGIPAKASQVNRNFETLDSLIGDQIDQFNELRESMLSTTDSLRQDLARLRQKAKVDSQAMVETVRAQFLADTGWKALNLPKGTVIGLLASAGPDGYLPGSDKIWQQIEAFGGVDGLPMPVAAPVATSVAAAPVPAPATMAVAVPDSAGLAKLPSDSTPPAVPPVAAAAPAVIAAASPAATPAPAPIQAATKPVFRWFVKVK